MLRSIEADVYPRAHPERAEQIDGALGDGSQFQATFGYYAHGVGPETAKAPAGWEDRPRPRLGLRLRGPTRGDRRAAAPARRGGGDAARLAGTEARAGDAGRDRDAPSG